METKFYTLKRAIKAGSEMRAEIINKAKKDEDDDRLRLSLAKSKESTLEKEVLIGNQKVSEIKSRNDKLTFALDQKVSQHAEKTTLHGQRKKFKI